MFFPYFRHVLGGNNATKSMSCFQKFFSKQNGWKIQVKRTCRLQAEIANLVSRHMYRCTFFLRTTVFSLKKRLKVKHMNMLLVALFLIKKSPVILAVSRFQKPCFY
jgi:hypothetical protein